MSGPLLATKLHVPRRGRGYVVRPRLDALLESGQDATLTLVSAPAGFGKTTLLSEWLARGGASEGSVAWLSIDQRDNDPAMFWRYVVEALRIVAPAVGGSALTLLESSRAPTEAVLATLINDIDAVPDEISLVLDDYHLIDMPAIHDSVRFLLEHRPRQLRLVIAGRADPPLPVARLRSRGELVEIRAAQLRFTPDEAASYLTGAMGLNLTPADVDALDGRTEGWIAALQLAALSLRGRGDAAGFIAGFAGDDRYIVDYLVEEVVGRQSAPVQRFLLRTSILDRLNGPLCDAVTGQADGRATLEALERANLFLFRLDDRRRWYRYHQLFADVLRNRLVDEAPDELADLNLRASNWFDRNGQPAEAIRHAFAAKDFRRAAELVEAAIPDMARTRQEATVCSWLEALPDDLVSARPALSIGLAGALLLCGRTGGVEARLLEAERRLPPATVSGGAADPPEAAGAADSRELRRLAGMIEVYRGALALAGGDPLGTVTHTRRAVELAPDDDHLGRAGAAGLSGLALWTTGDLEGGYSAYTECMNGLRRAGHIADTFGCAIALADIRRTQGRLDDAMHTYQEAVDLGAPDDGSVMRGTADMFIGMSEIHCERGDVVAATEEFQRSRELGDAAGLPQNPYRWRVALARIRQSEGDLRGAIGMLDEAELYYVPDYFPPVRPISAIRARLFVALGELDRAVGWGHERGLSADDDVSYLREFEHLTLVRILVATYRAQGTPASIERANRLLDRLLRAADLGQRTGSVLEILILQALAHQARGDVAGAISALQRALTVAQPERYQRIFVDEGAPMAALLKAGAKRGITGAFVRCLLTAVDQTAVRPLARPGLTEPLSPREMDVLRLLGTDLDGPEIARQLFVSLNTVRTHTKSIYAKLGVSSRRAAVRRAGELEISLRRDR